MATSLFGGDALIAFLVGLLVGSAVRGSLAGWLMFGFVAAMFAFVVGFPYLPR